MPIHFFIAYRTKDGAFRRAAETWANETVPANETCLKLEVKFVPDLKASFLKLMDEAEKAKAKYRFGALFVHSSSPAMFTSDSSPRHGIHFRPFQPRTMGEMRYNEHLLKTDGNDTANIDAIKALPKLPWEKDGKLWVFGCSSGADDWGKKAIAQHLANSQGVKTIGMAGGAYVSSDPLVYKEPEKASKRVYLRSYWRGENMLLNTSGVLKGHNAALPDLEFSPEQQEPTAPPNVGLSPPRGS